MGSLQDVLAAKNLLLKSKNKEIQGLHKTVKLLREELKTMSESFSDRPSWAAKSCCEEAALNAAEVDRLTRERDEAQEEIAAQKRNLLGRIEEVETERDELQAQLKDAKNQRDHYMERLAMRHAQPKPNAAEDRPTLDSEAVMKCLRDAWTTDDYGPPAFSFVSATNAIMALTPAVEGCAGMSRESFSDMPPWKITEEGEEDEE